MNTQRAVLAALAAAVASTSVAAAAPSAARQRVAITMKDLPRGTFVFAPHQAGRLKPDSGTVRHTVANYTPRVVIRNGQSVEVYEPVVWLLRGKRGTLTIREPRNEWVDAGTVAGGPEIGTGTWTVVRGTGQYARVRGGGRTAHAGLNGGSGWFAHQEGFLTVPQ